MPRCLSLNGSTQYLSRADDAILVIAGRSFAVAAWVYLTADANGAIVAKTNTAAVREFALQYNTSSTDTFKMSVFDVADGTEYACNATAFGSASLNTWHHVVGWYDAENQEVGISVNGSIETPTAVSGSMGDTAAAFSIGARNNGGTYGLFWPGRIQDVHLFVGEGAVPTAAEAVALYNDGVPIPWYLLDQYVPRLARWLKEAWPLSEEAGTRIGELAALSLAATGSPTAADGLARVDDSRVLTTIISGSWTSGNPAGQETTEGDAWTQHGTDSVALTAANGRAYKGASGSALVYVDKIATAKELVIEFELESKSDLASQASGIVIDLQAGTGNKNGYVARYDSGNNRWELGKFVANTFTSLSTYSEALSNASVYDVRYVHSPTVKQLWRKLTASDEYQLVCQTADDTLSLQPCGRVGVRVTGSTAASSTTGLHIGPPVVKRGTWEVCDVFRVSAAGGADSKAAYHVSYPFLSESKLHVIADGRETDYNDGRPMTLFRKEVTREEAQGAWPLSWSSEAAVSTATAGNASIGVGYRNSDPLTWVLANGDILVMWARFDPGYSAVGNDPSPALTANVGGEGDTDTVHVWLTRSTDEGATWEDAVEITDQVKDTALWSVLYPGQGQGMVLSDGTLVAASGHKIYDGGNGTNKFELIYSSSFVGTESGSPDLSEVVFSRGGDGTPEGQNEVSTVRYGDNLYLLPREPLSNSETWRYNLVGASEYEEDVPEPESIGLPTPGVRASWWHTGGGWVLAYPGDPQSARRQNARVAAGSDVTDLQAVSNGGTLYPGLGLIERGGAQYTSVVSDDTYIYVSWGRGGMPTGSGAVWTNIMGSIGLARASYADLGLPVPPDPAPASTARPLTPGARVAF